MKAEASSLPLDSKQLTDLRGRRVLSGMRVSGQLHIGHYFGALINYLSLQSSGAQCFFGAMDWHGLTTHYKRADQIRQWSQEMMADWLAWGIDPEKATLFVQSQVPEHLELFWIFASLTPMGWLERVPTWKDAEQEALQSDTRNLGRFAYPVLQAADIAIYKAELVPVGQDQVAHLEMSREILRRFNFLYQCKMPEAQALLTRNATVLGFDGRKMSKSYDNGIFLSESSETLSRKVKAAPTDPQRVRRQDPGEPTRCQVYATHKLFSSASDLEWVEQGCRTAGIGCGDCKGRLIQNMELVLKEPRERRAAWLSRPEQLQEVVSAGSKKAQKIAQESLKEFKEAMKIS